MTELFFFLMGLILGARRALLAATLLYVVVAIAAIAGLFPGQTGNPAINWWLFAYTVEMSATGLGICFRFMLGARTTRARRFHLA